MAEMTPTPKYTIWKFPLRVGENRMSVPTTVFTPLTAQLQGDNITLWALVAPSEAAITRVTLHVIGTGWPVPMGLTYLATVQQEGFVWHVFTT